MLVKKSEFKTKENQKCCIGNTKHTQGPDVAFALGLHFLLYLNRSLSLGALSQGVIFFATGLPPPPASAAFHQMDFNSDDLFVYVIIKKGKQHRKHIWIEM